MKVSVLEKYIEKRKVYMCRTGKQFLSYYDNLKPAYEQTDIDFLLWSVHQVMQPVKEDARYQALVRDVFAYALQQGILNQEDVDFFEEWDYEVWRNCTFISKRYCHEIISSLNLLVDDPQKSRGFRDMEVYSLWLMPLVRKHYTWEVLETQLKVIENNLKESKAHD